MSHERIETCEKCRWWDIVQEKDGHCRRYAIKPYIPNPEGLCSDEALWPITQHDDWCGEFEPHRPAGAPSSAESRMHMSIEHVTWHLRIMQDIDSIRRQAEVTAKMFADHKHQGKSHEQQSSTPGE